MDLVQKFEKGQTLVQEGTNDQVLYVIARGRLGVFKGEKQVAEISGKGEIVGELAVILRQPRLASVRALEDSYVVPVEGDLDNLVESHPDIVKAVLYSLAEKLTATTRDYWTLAETNVPVD